MVNAQFLPSRSQSTPRPKRLRSVALSTALALVFILFVLLFLASSPVSSPQRTPLVIRPSSSLLSSDLVYSGALSEVNAKSQRLQEFTISHSSASANTSFAPTAGFNLSTSRSRPWALPLGGNGLAQLEEAVRRSLPTARHLELASGHSLKSSRQQGVGKVERSASGASASTSANAEAAWELASALVDLVTPSAAELEMVRMTRQIDRSHQIANEQKPPPPPPPPSLPPPPPPPPCTGTAEECLLLLVASVPMFDADSREFVTPTAEHMPSADAASRKHTHWDSSGTVWSCRGQDCGWQERDTASPAARSQDLLAAMWDAWEPQLEHEVALDRCIHSQAYRAQSQNMCDAHFARSSAEETAQRARSRLYAQQLIAAGASRQAQALQVREYMDWVIAENDQVNHGFKCGSHCHSESVCSWCGTNLCCREGVDDPGCSGLGGDDHYRCTRTPEALNASAREAYAEAVAKRAMLVPTSEVHPLVALQAQYTKRAAGQSNPEATAAESTTVATTATAAADEWWRSNGKLQPFHGGDLEAVGQLEEAVRKRSWRGELVLTYGNAVGTSWVANLVMSLREAGIDHSLVVSVSAEHCAALATSPQRISCAHTSWRVPRCEDDPLRTLWYLRHHYMVRLIALGVNTLMLDGDVTVQRSPYAALKAAPLARHNLLVSLDHSPRCDAVNIGLLYCQNCTDKGRAQWIFQEALRRESSFCEPENWRHWGDGGSFWKASDAANITTGPHQMRHMASAQDQKTISDALGSSCCGKRTWRMLFPATFKVLKRAEFSQLHSSESCASMNAEYNTDLGRSIFSRELELYDGAPGLPPLFDAPPSFRADVPPRETVAAVPGDLLSSWHGTGHGETAGWSGKWLHAPPMLAHFVGGDSSGSKVHIMQALGWWRYAADEVVAHVRSAGGLSPQDEKISGALPVKMLQSQCSAQDAALCWRPWVLELPAALSGTGWRYGDFMWHPPPLSSAPAKFAPRLIGLRGTGATPVHETAFAFLESDLLTRARLAALGALLRRVPLRPRVHCDSPWAVLNKRGFRGVWQTPGERWPFSHVGLAIGRCGAHTEDGENAGSFCCSPLYGKTIRRDQVDCIASVHSSFLDKAEASYPRAARSSTQEIDLSELPRNADGALNATQVECLLSSPPYGEASVLLISLKAGETLPPLAGLREEAQRRADTFFTGKCTVHKALYDAASFAAASQEKLNASLAAMRADVASGSRGLLYQLNRKAAGKQLGWIVKGRQELGLSTELSEAQRIDVRKHLRAWQSASSLARDMAEAPVRPSSPVRTV